MMVYHHRTKQLSSTQALACLLTARDYRDYFVQ